MPAVCVTAAWRRGLKYLFPIPASLVLAALVVQAWAWIVAAGTSAAALAGAR